MSELDKAKESIAYLKFWLGITVVSDLSLLSWLLSKAETASDIRLYAAIVSVTVITMFAIAIHKRIERLMSKIGGL